MHTNGGDRDLRSPLPVGLHHLAQFLLEISDFVTQSGRNFELEFSSGRTHFVSEIDDEVTQILFGHLRRVKSLPLGRSLLVGNHRVVTAVALAVIESLDELVGIGFFTGQHFSDVTDLLTQWLRIDSVLLVLGHLNIATTIRLIDSDPHGISDLIGIHDDLAVNVTGGTAYGLNE